MPRSDSESTHLFFAVLLTIAAVLLLSRRLVWSPKTEGPSFFYGTYNAPSGTEDTDAIQLATGSDNALLQFWTPSRHTKEDVWHNSRERRWRSESELRDFVEPYYYVDNDEDRVRQFAEKLRADGQAVPGFSYWEVVGYGSTGAKRGYIWHVTIDRQRISREDVVRIYADFWERAENIYMIDYNAGPVWR